MTVCVLGSINRDIVARVAALPRAGETVAAREMLLLPGGKGANQAVAAARMGAATRMIAATGDDADGAAMRAYLEAERIDTRAIIVRPDLATGAAYIALDDKGENQIIVSAGANAAIDPGAAAAVVASDRVCLAQLETPLPAVAAFLSAAGRIGAIRILNAAPAIPAAAALFGEVDLLILNETELEVFLGLPPGRVDVATAGQARSLLGHPDQAAIVTLGAAGALLVEWDRATLVPGRSVPVVDTTGAGDCFCGAIAAVMAEGAGLIDALDIATRAASICVGRIGAGPAMPYRAEVDALGGRAS